MKNKLPFSLHIINFLFLTSLIFAQEENRQKPPVMKQFSNSEIKNMVDNLMQDYMIDDYFSGVVLVAKNNSPVYYKAFGKADFETARDNKIDTKFDIGSINKRFTSVAILQLVQKRLIKLDDNIGKYLNQFPQNILNKVTVRMLLNHTAGFGDYFMIPGEIENLKNLTTVNKLIDTFKNEPLLFEPGTDNRYSNEGYAVLGAVIESVSGMSYFDYIQKNILTPAGLTNTYFDYLKIRSDNEIPNGYMFSATNKRERIDYEKTPSPAGSAFATADDLLKFEHSFLYDNKLLDDSMKVIIANRFKKNESKTWSEFLSDASYTNAYAGGAPGRNSVVFSQPASGYVIVVLSNYDEPIAEQVGKNIFNLLAGKKIIEPSPNVFQKLYFSYKQNGKEYLKKYFNKIVSNAFYDMNEDNLLNRVGYDLMKEENVKEALEIFKVNTELFPGIANTWDSLAEACATDGQKEEAIKYYKKAIETNPQSPAAENSRKMLEQLEKE